MTDFSALMACVKDNPEDDTPRLILADWLDDEGSGGWAAFIRLGVELARYGADGPQVLAEEKRLWNEHKDARWCFPFEGELGWMRRGFMERVVCSLVDWLRWNEKIEAPVRDVRLTTWPHDLLQTTPQASIPIVRFPFGDGRDEWFDRVKCGVCEGTGLNRLRTPSTNADWNQDCPKCHGVPLNLWTCDRWPTVRFVMPEAMPQRTEFRRSYIFRTLPLGGVRRLRDGVGTVNAAPFNFLPPGHVILLGCAANLAADAWRIDARFAQLPPGGLQPYAMTDFDALFSGGEELFEGRSMVYRNDGSYEQPMWTQADGIA